MDFFIIGIKKPKINLEFFLSLLTYSKAIFQSNLLLFYVGRDKPTDKLMDNKADYISLVSLQPDNKNKYYWDISQQNI